MMWTTSDDHGRRESFVVTTKPVHWNRPRLNGTTGRFFVPKEQTACRDEIRLAARGIKPFGDSIISVWVEVVVERPANPKRLVPTRFDCDNASKGVLDALNGVLWDDDRLIADEHKRKRYADPGEAPGYRITVVELVSASKAPDRPVKVRYRKEMRRG